MRRSWKKIAKKQSIPDLARGVWDEMRAELAKAPATVQDNSIRNLVQAELEKLFPGCVFKYGEWRLELRKSNRSFVIHFRNTKMRNGKYHLIPTYVEYHSVKTYRHRTVAYNAKTGSTAPALKFVAKIAEIVQDELDTLAAKTQQQRIQKVEKELGAITLSGLVDEVFENSPFKTFGASDLMYDPNRGKHGFKRKGAKVWLLNNIQNKDKRVLVGMNGIEMSEEQVKKFLQFMKENDLIKESKNENPDIG